MIHILKKILQKILPLWVIIPLSKFKTRHFPVYAEFHDSESGKVIKMVKRKDTYIENTLEKNGLYGSWEKESLSLWSTLAKTSNVIVDIGANTGVYSILAAANNSDSTVIAIEPVPLNYALLSKNIRANHKSIKSFMIAISDKAGKANMYMLKGQINYMTSVNKNRYLDHPEIQNGAKMEEVTIAVKPFSYVVKKMNLSKIDLLKVDVEGHEIAVFSSMLDILKNSQPAIIVEVITQEIADYLQSIFELLPYTFIKINETEPSKIVSKIIEDNHCNFLLCPNKRLKEIEHKLLAN